MDPITAILLGIFGVNALGAKRAYDSNKPDEYGMNEVDRQYIQSLQQQVLAGKMTEEEARAKLGSKWKGSADYNKAYDYVAGLGDKGVNTLFGNAGGINLNGLIDSIIAHYTGAELTGAEREMNAFNAEEAQKSRDFTQFMAENKYSMETQSMAAAGVNPAVVYGGGNLVPTAANGAQASGHLGGTGDLFGALTALMRMPAELAKLKAEAEKAKKEGDAALENARANTVNAGANVQNAESNARNAGSNERQASAAERQAAVAEAEVGIKQILADNNTRATDAQISLWAEQEASIAEQIKWMPTYAEAELKKASAAQSSAYAAVQNARAALQNAASNAKLTDSQVLLNAVVRQKESIYRDYLPAQLSAQVDEMKARGYYWNEQGKLVDKQGKLVDAQVVHEYVSIGCDVARATCQVAGTIATGGAGGVLVKDSVPEGRPATYSSTPAGYGTYYDPD